MGYTLKNEKISITVEEHGAELRSLKKLSTGTEYMWCGDAAYWGGVSPILFPFVGRLWNKKYRYDGKTYEGMKPHGFARNMDFELLEQSENEIWFTLSDSDETYKLYPFRFQLDVGYELKDAAVVVKWRVINKDSKKMFFSIGGHPAFNSLNPEDETLKENGYKTEKEDTYMDFHMDKDELISSIIDMNSGTVAPGSRTEKLENGELHLTDELFDGDALVLENHQTQKVSVLSKNKKPYVTVSFDAPLFGVWSAYRKKAPFVCIEPWYGRCDANDFEGTLEERLWTNELEAGETFHRQYEIQIH